MTLKSVRLDDKYVVEKGRVYLSGSQALARLPMLQRDRDLKAGLNTAGYISGYRGSPLGGLDKELWAAKVHLQSHHIHFQPGVNEDLAATACWGTQQVNLFQGARYDGVFALWYGKGPGVDRSGDVFKHANNAGTAAKGGVLVLAGDDHAAKSSTVAHQSEYAFMDAAMPVLNPAGVQELLDYGLIGWAMSRYAGLWVAMKAMTETVDSSASVAIYPERLVLVEPADFRMPPGGLNIRLGDAVLAQEKRLLDHKLAAALAFARVNRLDRVVIDSAEPRFGILTTGKSYLDVRQALDDLELDEDMAARIGIRLYKVGMAWPLEPDGLHRFAQGLDEILVVEEKRPVLESQLKEQLYNWREDVRPRVVGKRDEAGQPLLPQAGELSPAQIARVIAARLERFVTGPGIKERIEWLAAQEKALSRPGPGALRIPYFCSGCPHNRSTEVPEGSRALAGIGCHYMAQWMDRRTVTFTHMGGEGASWIGQAPFTDTQHVFQNLGDGTYFHSGLLAIRAAVSAKVNITYKILFNDAVAMTGGQPIDGPLSVPILARQLAAEGVARIAVVSDEPDKYPPGSAFPGGVTFHHRDDLDPLQRDLRGWIGVSALIYDQTCAAEKRRRRKRGQLVDPPKRVFINELVCEGCGDCGLQSNCVSVVPVETEFGRKRAIDQSACNKDYSCLKGFCPSLVTIEGGRLRQKAGAGADADFPPLPEPTLPALEAPYGVVITGIGGTGVVTVGALLGMAAHLEGLGCSVLDMAGLAQKNGAVISHLRLAREPEQIHAVRIAAGGARLLIGCDLVVSAGPEALSKLHPGQTVAVVNDHEAMTADFTRNPDLDFPAPAMKQAIREAVGKGAAHFLDASRLAGELLGDTLAANLFLVGFAWQKGLLPLSRDAIERAIELNGAMVEFNQRSFLWGRRAAVDLVRVVQIAEPSDSIPEDRIVSATLDERIARRQAFLTAYHDAAYGRRYADRLAGLRRAEAAKTPGHSGLAEAAAQSLFALMAIKDEYEVARLFTHPTFEQALAQQFEGDFRLTYHLAPPILAAIGADGRPHKRAYGGWMKILFRLLARLKKLRGRWADPFRFAPDRVLERRLLAEYEALLDVLEAGLEPKRHGLAVELAALPQAMRGFGPVKAANVAKARERWAELWASWQAPAQRNAAE
ncbi:MAG: indolepyruvate ferredoxin oxidoreductase family protein [Rhodospirillales bacterium]|nr:indolepyruvate ferredoxin oxidoreductase family protein [Rhodospirillales bacterium]